MKARCSVADWCYSTDKRICTVWNIENCLEFLDVMKMWISCRTLSRGIQNLMPILKGKWDFSPINLLSINLVSRVSRPGWLDGLETRIRARTWWTVAEIFAQQREWSCWPWAGCIHSESAQSRATQRFWLGPSFKGICAVPTHQSKLKKAKTLSRYQWIKASLLLHRAGCWHLKSTLQTRTNELKILSCKIWLY